MFAGQGKDLGLSFRDIEAMAEAIDLAALSAGPFSPPPAQFPLPQATWHAILRSRRLRVFDWVIDAGFRLLNLLPRSNEHFLALAEHSDLQNKYAVARKLWPSTRENLEDFEGWLNAVAETEILLVELREPWPPANSPESVSDIVVPSAGVRLVQIDPSTLDLHHSIPEFSLPARLAAAELSSLRLRFPERSPVSQDALFVPGSGDEPEGFLVQIEGVLVSAVSAMMHQDMTVAQLRDRIGSDVLANLIQMGALSRWIS
ncbi:MAG: hypothetical protein E7813_21940 [Bradyrhizobium sp.]|uniref:hypothetical protein n=1 Tax=Bradyrhizobium sp. TaxID=376 RepID=UPI0012113FF6|nr:hypothetical protein [Bradyrhizobium sp.]THD61159.1 MAG: hypothetical protein E7813_21940 [Bradyrhizobium sp.]